MTNDPESWGEPIKTVHRDGRTVILRTGMWFTVGSWNKYRNALCINAPGYPPYPHDEQPTRWMDIPRGEDPRDAVVAAARVLFHAHYHGSPEAEGRAWATLRDAIAGMPGDLNRETRAQPLAR